MKSLSLATPHIIAMVGIPGSGKSHFAQKFAETFAAPFLCHHYLQHLTTDDNQVHVASLNLLREVVKTKKTILYEGDTDRRVRRDELAKIARKNNYKILFVWVQTDQTTARSRARDILPVASYDDKLRRFSPPHETEQYVVISGKHTYATQAKTLLKKLTEESRPATDTKRVTAIAPVVPPRSSNHRSRIQIL